MRSVRTVLLLAVLLGLMIPTIAFAQSGADTYKAKCAMCHGPDGKKENAAMGTKALTSPEGQKMSGDFVKCKCDKDRKVPTTEQSTSRI